jgi:hypothetical protein
MADALRLGYCAMRQRLEDRDRPVTETYVLASDYDALAARCAEAERLLRKFHESGPAGIAALIEEVPVFLGITDSAPEPDKNVDAFLDGLEGIVRRTADSASGTNNGT